MYHYIYQITNLINNKIYIGAHSTNNLNDDYMGSGKLIRMAICKYGINNFKKEILEFFDNHIEMFNREKEIVNEEFLNRKDVYNIVPGGEYQSIYYIQKLLKLCEKTKVKRNTNASISIRKKLKDDPTYRQKLSDTCKKAWKEGRRKVHPNFHGKKHLEETKIKIGKANSIHQKGNKNSQFGKIWITNGIENRKIYKDSLIPEGWKRGRKT